MKTSFHKILTALMFTLTLPLATGCDSQGSANPGPTQPPQYPYKVTTTVGMITDIVENVAGDKAEVTGLIGTGIDPHQYKPSRDDVVRVSDAYIVFYNGLSLEGKMTDIFVRVATRGKPVYAVTDTILSQGDYVMTDEADHYDPHVWMDVQGWIRAVGVVRDALTERDPDNAAEYQANAEAYIAKLRELDAYAKRCIASIPEERRVLITAHDAFNYMGRAYGLDVRGIQGLSTESEPGLKGNEGLIKFIVERKIAAVFVETSVADDNVKALIEGAKARGHEVKIGGELYSDAMGKPGTYEGTYVGMIDHNVTTITRALGGDAPEGGMQGKLSLGSD